MIAIGVGGLEAENVMLGRASWMRLPDIIGVELSGRPGPGITATDVVLTLTEFLRKEKVVGAYLEFYGAGAPLTGRSRHHLEHGARYGATAAMFAIDQQTIDYLRLTGREDEQIALVETCQDRRPVGRQPDRARYERVLRFDLSTVVRTLAGPSNPHRRLPVADLAERGIAGKVENQPGLMPDGAVIIAAITSCTNTSNPRNVIAAGLLARKPRRAHAQALGQELAGAGSKAVALYLDEAGLTTELARRRRSAVPLAPTEHLHPPPAVLGRRAGRARAARHAPAGRAGRQHHHRPPVAVQRHPDGQRRRRIPAQDGPAGRGLQFLRHPSRRSPDRAAPPSPTPSCSMKW